MSSSKPVVEWSRNGSMWHRCHQPGPLNLNEHKVQVGTAKIQISLHLCPVWFCLKQADLSLRWAHMLTCTFCWTLAHREYKVSVFWYQVYQARLRECLLTSWGLPKDSTCILEAESGKLDIKRQVPGILFISLPIVSLFKLAIMT